LCCPEQGEGISLGWTQQAFLRAGSFMRQIPQHCSGLFHSPRSPVGHHEVVPFSSDHLHLHISFSLTCRWCPPRPLRASVRTTEARNGDPPMCSGHIDRSIEVPQPCCQLNITSC